MPPVLDIQTIQQLPNAERRLYQQLRHARGIERHGCFLAESGKVMEQLLRSPLEVCSILLDEAWLEFLRPAFQARGQLGTLYLATAEEIGHVMGFSVREAVRAVAKVPDTPSLESFIESCRRPLILVALDELSNAENVGAMVRNAAALGADAVLLGPTTHSPYLCRAIRVSMGTVFQLPVLEVRDLPLALRGLEDQGICTMAAALHPAALPLHQANFRRDVCLVFGNEGSGVRPAVLEACREKIILPMTAGVDSLNVASAGAAMLYELRRQRGDWPH